MQAIHPNVVVFTTHRELQARTPKPGKSGSTTALQYIAENTGFDVVTFRVDFGESANINLHRPAERKHQGGTFPTNELQKASREVVLDCQLRPFERRVLVYVVKRQRKRAFVQVNYTVTTVLTPSVQVVAEAQERTTKILLHQLQRSNQTFSHLNQWKALPCRPQVEVDRACAEINRYFREYGEVFVDASFPPQAVSLCDSGTLNKLSEADSAVYTLCSWENLHDIVDSSWAFATPKMRPEWLPHKLVSASSFTSGLPGQGSFLCALSIITPYCELWLRQWFPSLDVGTQIETMAAIPVTLCDRGLMWQDMLIDLFLPSFPLGRGLMAPRNVHGELYAALLHKAFAKLKGSYAAVARIPTITILQELTGSPCVCLYRRPVEGTITDSSNELMKLQNSIHATLDHRRHCLPNSDETSSLVVVTCGQVDDHHRAFTLTIPSDGESRETSVVLHDASGKYLRQHVGKLAEFERDLDPSALCLSWEQFFSLEPVVWSLALTRWHEQRLRQIFLHQNDTLKSTTVVGVPTLTTIVFTFSYSGHFNSGNSSQQVPVDLDVTIAQVKTDFSLAPIEENRTDDTVAALMSYQNHDGVFRIQVVRTLSAGEYIVIVSAKRSGCTQSHPEEVELASDKGVLTPASVDTNVQLAFDCLDRRGYRALSESDVDSFLQLHEQMMPSQYGKEALRSFLHQHASSSCPGSDERRLTLDDFRELYLGQAIQDFRDLHTDSVSNVDSLRTRFQELVWQDLLRLLSSSSGDVSVSQIESRDVVEMVCCFHSDTPLLKVLALPDDEKSSFNHFNM